MPKARVVFLVSIFCSIGGIVYAVFASQRPDDGPRGGALGAAVALAFIVLTRGYGMQLYDTANKLVALRGAQLESDADISELSRRIDRLANAIKTDAEEQKTASQLLACATFIGTIITGFGDKLALGLIRLRLHW
jgi:hypothetical protein